MKLNRSVVCHAGTWMDGTKHTGKKKNKNKKNTKRERLSFGHTPARGPLFVGSLSVYPWLCLPPWYILFIEAQKIICYHSFTSARSLQRSTMASNGGVIKAYDWIWENEIKQQITCSFHPPWLHCQRAAGRFVLTLSFFKNRKISALPFTAAALCALRSRQAGIKEVYVGGYAIFPRAPLRLMFHTTWRPSSPRQRGNWISARGCDSIWVKTFWREGRFARDDRRVTTLLVQNNILDRAPCVVGRVSPSSTSTNPLQVVAAVATRPFRPLNGKVLPSLPPPPQHVLAIMVLFLASSTWAALWDGS